MIQGPTIEQRMMDANFRSSGFDYMRLVLCAAVILQHSGTTSYGQLNGELLPFGLDRCWTPYIVSMFFTLSGFLVSGSFFRCRTLVSFLGLRVLRIMPALAGEVLLSAILIGPFLTILPIHEYFADPKFRIYLLNILGDIHFQLPGLFTNNPIPGTVNNQLWTIPFELLSYMVLTVLAFSGIALHRYFLLALCVAIQAALLIFAISHQALYAKIHGLGGISGYHDVYFFIIGILFYSFRDRIILTWPIFVIAFATSEIMLFTPGGNNLIGLPIAYMTIYLGLFNPPKPGVLFSGDYSYGMYLYGFPIQQVIAYFMPAHRVWYINFTLGLLGAFAIARVSWHYIEKPALSLRGKLLLLEDAAIRVLPRWGSRSIRITLSQPGQ
jgi:peptidoglycan/LPS O-acetylase OafA/YrhL